MLRRIATRALAVAVLASSASMLGFAMFVPGARASDAPAPVRRVLIISLPHVAWHDVAHRDLPNLEALLRRAAVADMTNRTIGKRDLASAYLTIGAGTRAASTGLPADGEGLEPGEQFGAVNAADVFGLRTSGHSAAPARAGGILQLGVAALTQFNDDQDVDVTLGALGDALAKGGFSRAVIGNGDGLVVDEDQPSFRRFAVNALMGADGMVPGGRVDSTLITPDDSAAFGVRQDFDATMAAFEDVWRDRAAVLVEASDLARLGDFAPLASAAQVQRLQRVALERADELVGRLVAETDPARDAIMVVGPGPSNAGESLTMVALASPGGEAGFLRSASTRRTGFVLLADVSPTIVELAGLPTPKKMSGSAFTVRPTSKDTAARLRFLVDESNAGRFRDRVRGPTVLAYTVVQAALVVGAFVVLRRARRGPSVRVVRFGALFALGFVPSVYVARLFALHRHGTTAFFMVVALGALAFAAVFAALGALLRARPGRDPARRRSLAPIMLALGTVVALQVVDVLLGARLQFGSAFGYSPTIGVRVAGLGNISYAFLSSAAVLLSGLVAHRVGGRRGAWGAIALLVVALLVDIAPFWGADFGGILSMVPAFGVTAILLLGIRVRVRVRTAVVVALGTFLVLVAAAAVDLSRPTNDQTHVGRLVNDIGENGFSKLFSVIGRKLDQNLMTLTSSDWRPVIPIALAMVAYLAFSQRRWLARLVARLPELRAALIGFAVLAVLGYALNDSGIAIPAVMLTVLNATLVWLALGELEEPGDDLSPAASRERPERPERPEQMPSHYR